MRMSERADHDLSIGIADFEIVVVREHLPCCVVAFHEETGYGT